MSERELGHVDGMVDALMFLIQTYNDGKTENIGTGVELAIKELAKVTYQRKSEISVV